MRLVRPPGGAHVHHYLDPSQVDLHCLLFAGRTLDGRLFNLRPHLFTEPDANRQKYMETV